MYLRNYYEQKGYFLLEDTKQFKFKNLNKNAILNLKINVKNEIEIKRINFIIFLLLRLWHFKIQLNKKCFLGIINDYNVIFSFVENLILFWLPLSYNIKTNLIGKNSSHLIYDLKYFPLLDELEILLEFSDYYYHVLETNISQIHLNVDNLSLFEKENLIRFLKVPLYANPIKWNIED